MIGERAHSKIFKVIYKYYLLSWKDTARVLSEYVDGIVIRVSGVFPFHRRMHAHTQYGKTFKFLLVTFYILKLKESLKGN